MSEGPRLIQTGITGLTPVFADVITLGVDPVTVTLTANYTLIHLPGMPWRPSLTGASIPEYPHTILSGAVLSLHAFEATALIAAGGAHLWP